MATNPSYLDILDELLSGFDGWRYLSGPGVLTLGFIGTPEDETADHVLTVYHLREDYSRIPGGEPAQKIEVEYAHIGHRENAGDLLDDATEADAGYWSEPVRLERLPVPNAAEVYKLSSPIPVRIAARWSTQAGAAVELARQIARSTRREGGEIPLGGSPAAPGEWMYGAITPGQYVSITAPRVPGGTATAVIWSLSFDLGSMLTSAIIWGCLSE